MSLKKIKLIKKSLKDFKNTLMKQYSYAYNMKEKSQYKLKVNRTNLYIRK